MYTTIDADGFLSGSISPIAVNDFNRHLVVDRPVPAEDLPQFHRWRWVAGSWVKTLDRRGSVWYDPNNEGSVFRPELPGDEPPDGWVHWVPGQNRVFTQAASLNKAKSDAWARVKTKRDAMEFGLFRWGDHAFDGDIEAQRRINLAALEAYASMQSGQPWSKSWTLANNTTLIISAPDMIGIAAAMGGSINAAHEWARVRRSLIEAATTEAEVDAIVV